MDSKFLFIIGLVFSLTCNSVIAKGGFRPPKSDLTKHFKVNQKQKEKYKQKYSFTKPTHVNKFFPMFYIDGCDWTWKL